MTTDNPANSPDPPDDPRSSLDPTLDTDLAQWHADAGHPRVRLLGPVSLDRARGTARNQRADHRTELAAYLASHPNGATWDELARTVFARSGNVAVHRRVVAELRRWLGYDTHGKAYLPKVSNRQDRLTLDGVLVDADLFLRLTRRAKVCGAGGAADRKAALALVSGRPMSHSGWPGYGWLDGDPVALTYTNEIHDIAHNDAAHHLASGQPRLAVGAVRTGLSAGDDNQLMFDLIAAHLAMDEHGHVHETLARLPTTDNVWSTCHQPERPGRDMQRRHGPSANPWATRLRDLIATVAASIAARRTTRGE